MRNIIEAAERIIKMDVDEMRLFVLRDPDIFRDVSAAILARQVALKRIMLIVENHREHNKFEPGSEESLRNGSVSITLGEIMGLARVASEPESEFPPVTASTPAQSGLVAERNRLADILWSRGMTHEDIKERSGWLLAATVVRRGRELTEKEMIDNIFRAVAEEEE